jgi:cytochrome c peroxidase
MLKSITAFSAILLLASCSSSDDNSQYVPIATPNITAAFGTNINLNSLANYAAQTTPPYITRINNIGNPVTDKGATLGRVLFYDKNLSSDNTVSCATCHIQSNAFSDSNVASNGVNGSTGRHTMRLINTRFANERKFFWDERAANLQTQTTMPVRNHAEMGFSGADGDPDFDVLVTKLADIGYYKELFQYVYGSEEITETKIQSALSQFVNSIQSFDSKYDAGRALAANEGQPFVNFSPLENQGKNLFLLPPQFNATGRRIGGGVGCAGCHAAPEFDIAPNSGNNNVTTSISGLPIEIGNTRAPSLRDILKPNGTLNGPLMHTGAFNTLASLIGHYDLVIPTPGNTNLDPKLRPNGFGQQLNMTEQEKNALTAFLKTLSGNNVYTDPKWSNPFN